MVNGFENGISRYIIKDSTGILIGSIKGMSIMIKKWKMVY
jgi:hypothetical protein